MIKDDGRHGIINIVGNARWGKTEKCKEICKEFAKTRHVVVFDPRGEYVDIDMPDKVVYSDFGFYISDFKCVNDWILAGFSEKEAVAIDYIVSEHEIDNPYNLLARITHIDKQFNLNAVMRLIKLIREHTLIPNGDTEFTIKKNGATHHIDNWAEIVKRNQSVIIDISSHSEKPEIAIEFILRDMRCILDEIKPLIVIENVDELWDVANPNADIIYEINQYSWLYGRYGVKMVYVFQNPNGVSLDIQARGTEWFIAPHNTSHVMTELLNTDDVLYMDAVKLLDGTKDKRDMVYMRSN